jgi:hypothetical protein
VAETDFSRGDGGIPRQEEKRTRTRAKTRDFGETLRRQFRGVLKSLTQRLAPSPKRRHRRTEDTGRGFRAAATRLLQRIFPMPLFQAKSNAWDMVLWLHVWEYGDPASVYQLSSVSEPGEPGVALDL